MRRRWIHVCAIALVAVCTASPARADDPLAEGRRLKAELRYADARVAVERVLRTGTSGPAELAAIYRLLGELSAGMDERVAAEAYFARLLSLRPEATLEAGASPKLSVPFQDARTRMAGRGLVVSHQVGERRAALTVSHDPLGLIAGARARYRRGTDSPRAAEARGSGTVELAFEGHGPVVLELAAIDEYGNELVVLGGLSWRPAVRRPRALIGRWQLWGGVAVALAAAGTSFGLAARSAERDLDDLNERARSEPFMVDFAEAETLRARADRRALIANLCFAGTAAVGVTAAVLLIRQLRTPGEGAQLSVVPSLNSGSIGVVVGGAF